MTARGITLVPRAGDLTRPPLRFSESPEPRWRARSSPRAWRKEVRGQTLRQVAWAVAIAALAASEVARADSMDPSLERLVLDASCQSSEALALQEFCQPDHSAFKRLMNQWGFAFAPSALHAVRTTGLGGFQVTLEGGFTEISEQSSYWKQGTRGARDPAQGQAPATNSRPDGVLQLYSIKLRKGFGFGFELSGSFGFMPHTRLMTLGADARFALLEGFREKTLGMLPDLGVGAGVRTVTGSSQFSLNVVGLDVQLSKSFPIQDISVLTPWVGYQHLWIIGDSAMVDLTPGFNALNRCGFAGDNLPGNPDPEKQTETGDPLHDGLPVCPSFDQGDFANNAVFESAHFRRHRLLLGVNYRYEMVVLGAGWITDLADPASVQSRASDREALRGQARQWSLVFELGAAF